MKNGMKVLFLLMLPFLSYCTKPAEPAKTASKGKGTSSLTQTGTKIKDTTATSEEIQSADESSTSDTSTPVKRGVDPETASGSIEPTIGMSPSDILNDPNIVFPSITFKKTNADFFQVMRCVASYDVVSLQGASIRNSGKTFSYGDLKGAWGQALNDRRNCKIVAQYVTNSPYVDMPAPTGNFYYVANPCIAASNSSTQQEGCSYALSFTKPTIDYKNNFIEKMQVLAEELARAQAALNADIDDVRITAKKFELALNLCEEYYAFTETEKSLQRGLIMLGLNLMGAVLGYAVAGGNGAMMAGMLAQMMGGPIISDLLGITPAVNSCLYGEEIVGQQGLRKEKDIQRARDNANFFESSFHSKTALDHLSELVLQPSQQNPTGGKLAQDVVKVQAVMAKMHDIDQKVLAVDSQVGAANKFLEAKMAEFKSGTTPTTPIP